MTPDEIDRENEKASIRWNRDTIAEGVMLIIAGAIVAGVELETLRHLIAYGLQLFGFAAVLLGCYRLVGIYRRRRGESVTK